MMNNKVKNLLIISLITVVIVTVWNYSYHQIKQDISLVSISTDKKIYQARDKVHISIRNQGNHTIDIYCPVFCALGNFPTRVERLSNAGWDYFAGFCPSIEPLFGSGVYEGDYIRHSLSARSSFELEISNIEALGLQQDEKLRIVYYIRSAKVPIYSNEFTIKQ